MVTILVQRFCQMIFIMFGISVLVFLIFFATPGADPASRIAGRNAAPETIAAVRHDFGLDRSLPVQYVVMMKKLFVTRDLVSFTNRGMNVVPAILQATPVTLSLVFGAAIFWVLGSLLFGVVAAALRGSFIDTSLMTFSLVGMAVPVFWLAEVTNLLSQSRFHDTIFFSWVPALGYVAFTENPLSWFRVLLLPWLTLSVGYIGIYGRVLRANIIEIYQEDFIRTARAKGISEMRVLLRHALRMSLVPFVTMFGLDFGVLVGGGALVTEVIFGLNGVGKLTYDSLQSLDLPVIMASVMYASFFVVVANAAVDLTYVMLDPRIGRH
ncbi:ABC transporter permease [Agrobacterium vitis]|uniref:ABC transporter permease n=1 Tax=Agrobacterium vitis TaxID=373 RepID=UPI0015748918|nr:ABC transporter permease [Agrobacterium vitis]NSZ19545.1 ABC transporter permease [Agrobacterium vitis]QZO06853.1 ABC transporter permease [Agrobacterium vitis]UJL91514.1 ABC transporter permease [Agrobacterium vitis]